MKVKLEGTMIKDNDMHHALESLEASSARDIEDKLWWIQGRKSIIRRHLKKVESKLGKIESIMDIGCGSGGNLEVLAEFGKVAGIEPSAILAERSRARGIASQIYELPAWQLNETKSINLFSMFDVLEHIEDDEGFLKQLKQCASANHTLLLSVPACPYLFGEHDILLSHHRRYSKKMLNDCLVSAGYKPVSMRYYMFFPFPFAVLFRLIDKVKSGFGFKRKTVDLGTVPPLINTFLTHALNFESTISEYIRFPTGLWLFAIAEPNK
jgi:SAM-dependent methyltransferase